MGERKFCYKCMEKYDMRLHICPNCGYDDTTPHNPMYITPGTILHDRYLVGVLLEYNGEGAYYAGHDISTGCKVLIREYMPINLCTRVRNKAVISVNYNNLAKYKAFMAEYTELNKSLARLRNNSNINPVLDMFSENNTTYTIFEDLGGMRILDFLKDNAGELSWEQVSKIFPPLFTTIGILHNAGIIHRAISPDTIYINDKEELKLSGFCVSAVRTANAGLEHELFKGYAAPEQYSSSSSSRQGSWTDVYGVCALLYRCLTGCMPVDARDRIRHDDLCEPSMLNPNIPENVSRVIMNGMNLSGRDRIQTITELVTRLFEQPLVKSVQTDTMIHEVPRNINSGYIQQPAYQQPVQNPVQYVQPRNSGQYIAPQNNQYIPPQNYYQPPYQNDDDDDDDDETDDVRYEPVNMVDKLRVPILISILLFAILLIIALVLVHMIEPDRNSREKNQNQTTTSAVEDNIVTGEAGQEEAAPVKLDTEMPDLRGRFYELTVDKYADFFTFEASYDYNSEYEADMIYEQDIEPGTAVATGCLVKVKVSKGPDEVEIPSYEGLTVKQYEALLRDSNISNYSLIVSSDTSAQTDSITMLELNGEEVFGGDIYSNKKGLNLIVYYLPSDETPTFSGNSGNSVSDDNDSSGYYSENGNDNSYGYDDSGYSDDSSYGNDSSDDNSNDGYTYDNQDDSGSDSDDSSYQDDSNGSETVNADDSAQSDENPQNQW